MLHVYEADRWVDNAHDLDDARRLVVQRRVRRGTVENGAGVVVAVVEFGQVLERAGGEAAAHHKGARA